MIKSQMFILQNKNDNYFVIKVSYTKVSHVKVRKTPNTYGVFLTLRKTDNKVESIPLKNR